MRPRLLFDGGNFDARLWWTSVSHIIKRHYTKYDLWVLQLKSNRAKNIATQNTKTRWNSSATVHNYQESEILIIDTFPLHIILEGKYLSNNFLF